MQEELIVVVEFKGAGEVESEGKSRGGSDDSECLPWGMITRRGLAESRAAAHASRLLLAAGPRLRAHTQGSTAPPRAPAPAPCPRMMPPARQAATRHPYTDMLSFVSNLIVTLSSNKVVCAWLTDESNKNLLLRWSLKILRHILYCVPLISGVYDKCMDITDHVHIFDTDDMITKQIVVS